MSAYYKFLAEIRAMQAILDRMADLLTLIAPRGNASRLTAEEMKVIRRTMDEAPIPYDLQVWSCGHRHATRDEAAACLQEQRRSAAAHHPV